MFTLFTEGLQRRELEDAGIRVTGFGLDGNVLSKFRGLLRIRSAIRNSKADVIHGWMYHSALIAWLFAPQKSRVLLGVHHLDPRDGGLSRTARLAAYGCQLVSGSFGGIVYVAKMARRLHEAVGFSVLVGRVIGVGVNASEMMIASESERARSRAGLGIKPATKVLLHVARYHPDKDQRTLLHAFLAAEAQLPGLILVLVGRNLVRSNRELYAIVQEFGLEEKVILAGEHRFPQMAFNASDVFCLSSRTEAFPVSLVEAMQCGLRPVVTDVGECRWMVGSIGIVVPPNSWQDLSAGLIDAAGAPGPTPLEIRRQGAQYSLVEMTQSYQSLYEQICIGA